MNDFETIEQTIGQLSDKWNKVTTGSQNKTTFMGMQKQLQTSRMFLQNEWKDVESKLTEISNEKIYDPSHINKKRMALMNKYQKVKEEVVAGTLQDIENMVANKFKKLDSMIVTTPTSEQMSLLQTIRMRGGNISRGELMKCMSYFFENYQALKIYETVAAAAGYHISTPMSGDVMDLYGALDRGGEYLKMAARQLAKPGKPDPAYGAFFYSDPQNPGNADPQFQEYINLFDKPVQMQEYHITTALSEAEKAQVNSYFRQLDGLDPANAADNLNILRVTDQIMKQHPDDIRLMKRSQYGRYVREVEEINKINAAKAEAMSNEQKEASAS